MENFEIHITGDYKILAELEKLNIKSITVGLLKPNGDIIREEYMSSTIQQFTNVDDCIQWVNGLTAILQSKGVHIIRKKIECQPSYYHYINRTIYMEAHWKIDKIKENTIFPISENMRSGKLMATYRIYDKDNFNQMKKLDVETEIELCLMDTYVSEDFDWFDLYQKK